MPDRYHATELGAFACALLVRAGLDKDKATIVADILLEGDLLGHNTHGLALLAGYLADLEKGVMTKTGEPRVIADFPAAVTWDGNRLPGPWLVTRALDVAVPRARQNGTCTVVIRRSHHIACLAAYLQRVAEQGLMVILTCSDPAAKGVAPHGGRRAVMTPNPLAAAWPTEGEPVMLDVSMGITTNAMTRRAANEGRKLSGQWFVDGAGHPTNDPAAVFATPPGAIMPMGGADHGHKGYALGLLVEALTGGLAGFGRADRPEGWMANVFLQVINPALFGGREDFVRQTEHVVAACRATPPRPGFERVRLPGESGLRRRAEQLAQGVELYPTIMPALAPWAQKLGVQSPAGG
ncbi:Ldh family oxidoreductase [Opitutus sp. GAS368]|uniref:Ldh family oxidoreductase n=1 Tax=Opitutus sp. GAS368 TaxID=1882749 RepID=UPI00087B6CB2|nr:Ldh family oxidoreductase [Opitutus sp. GAS368]SDR71394.1 L-lactate dehydrogenase [Opitutus sp. GAS368]